MDKKICLKESFSDGLADDLNLFFYCMVNVKRIKFGGWQTVDVLVSEEALLFARFLGNKRKDILRDFQA